MKIYDYQGRSNICGEQIRRFRRERKLSQGELAARLQLQEVQLDQKAVSRVEKGERFVADFELVAFSRALRVPLEELLGFPGFSEKGAGDTIK
mgnify:FL=1